VDVAEQVNQAARERRGLVLAFAAFGLFWGAWAALLPALKAQVGLSDGELGLALGALALAALPSMPLAGRLVDRFGAAKLVRLSLVAFAVVTPFPALTRSTWGLVPAFVLIGLTTGFLDVVINTAAAAWERLEEHGLMALCHAMFSAGVLVGSVMTGVCRDAGAGPGLVLTVVAVVLLGVALREPTYRQADAPVAAPGRRGRLPRVLLLIGVLLAASFLVEDAVQSWSALRLEGGLGAPPWVGGLGPGLFAAAMTGGRLGTHALGARFTNVRLVVSSGGLIALGSLGLALATHAAAALVGIVIIGAGTSVLAPTLFSAVGSRSDAGRHGADLAAVSALGYLGFLAGPPLVGLVSGATSLPVALGLLGLLGVGLAAAAPRVLEARVG